MICCARPLIFTVPERTVAGHFTEPPPIRADVRRSQKLLQKIFFRRIALDSQAMTDILPRMLAGIVLLVAAASAQAQRTGLVLSGGGASGLAHIGVIQALEEEEIPIDYITGTSMGALVGGLYAAGYAPEEMIRFAESPQFLRAISGELEDRDLYYFTRDPEDASIIRFKFDFENFLQKTLPANVVTPNLMEYLFMDVLAPASAAARYDFDRLMVPFRCVAADVVNKEQVVFSEGSLPVAMRASSTYPFYYRPLVVNGTMLFDGGLYNNFPADVMYEAFLPDVILGSNVASANEPPDEDDLISQIRNMITIRSDYTIQCDEGLIIEPVSEIGVFDFDNVRAEVAKGYAAAKERMEEIKSMVARRVPQDSVAERRSAFRSKFPEKNIGNIQVTGDLNQKQTEYVRSMLGPSSKDSVFTFDKFRGQFLRIAQDDKIRHIRPLAQYDSTAGNFGLSLKVRRERNLTAFFGGNFSSRPINIGYVGLKYNVFGRSSTSIMANSYFGRFYGSAMVRAKIDFGGKKRWSLEPHMVLNRWDYFRNFATFFEQSRPSFIVKNEVYGGLGANASAGNNAVWRADLRYGETIDRYYQTENFTVEDTSDVTRFSMGTFAAGYDRNTLNRKVYANKGTRLQFTARGIYGSEVTDYGTTRPVLDSAITANHLWADIRLKYENYFVKKGFFTLGLDVEAVYSSKPFFANYTASVISSPAYEPIPESRTFFIEEFRAHEYAALGLRSVFEIRKNLDVRLEGYAFQPRRSFVRLEDNLVGFGEIPGQAQYIAAGALVFNSPLGPISLNINYYSSQIEQPWSFLFNFGYTLFNKSIYEL